MSHNTNVIVLHATAGKDLVVHEPAGDGFEFATVFALHNRYVGKDKEEHTVPISVLFSGRTLSLAKLTIVKGASFIATGELDYTPGKRDSDAGFYQIRCHQLTPISSPKEKD